MFSFYKLCFMMNTFLNILCGVYLFEFCNVMADMDTNGDYVDMSILLRNIPEEAEVAKLIYFIDGESESSTYDSKWKLHKGNGTEKPFKVKKKLSTILENSPRNNITFFVKLFFKNNSICGTAYVQQFCLCDTSTNKCMLSNGGCTINLDWKNTCKNLTKHTNKEEYEGITSNSIIESGVSLVCPQEENWPRDKITESLNLRFPIMEHAHPEYRCYYEGQEMIADCKTTSKTNIYWVQDFGSHSDQYLMKTKSVTDVRSSKLTLTLYKYDNMSVLYCEAVVGNKTLKGNPIALLYIDPVVGSKETYNGLNKEDPRITKSELSRPIHHTCNDGDYKAKYTQGRTFKYGEQSVSSDEMEMFCIYSNFSISRRSYDSIQFSRHIYNRYIYLVTKKETPINMYLIIGIPVTIALLSLIAWCLIRLVKKLRTIPKNNVHTVAVYSTAEEIHYARLSITQGSSDRIIRSEEQSPYAEIIGVLQPKNM